MMLLFPKHVHLQNEVGAVEACELGRYAGSFVSAYMQRRRAK